MNVKVLIIIGSPRKYGNTAKLAAVAAEGARDCGAQVKEVYLYDYRIEPCRGCVSDDQLACRYPCVIEDDMRELYKLVLDSDGMVVATPIYWYSPSSPVKAFIDRLTVFENMIFVEGRSWVEGKVAGVIAVGNDSGCIEVIANLYAVLNSMGFAVPPWALAYYTKTGDVLEDESAVMDAYNVGRVVALMARIVKESGVKEWYCYEKKRAEEAARKAREKARFYECEARDRKRLFEDFKQKYRYGVR